VVKVKVNASNLHKRLDKMTKNLNSLPWDKAANIVQQSVKSNFEVGGRYSKKDDVMGGTKKWTPRKDNQSHKILKKSGALQGSIYKDVHKNGFAIGSRLEYQAVHNFGYPKGNIAARPYLVVQEDDLRKIEKLLSDHITS